MARTNLVVKLIGKARRENLSPDNIDIYVYKNANKARTVFGGETVSRAFNALTIPGWVKYALFKYGKPFIYQGIRTRSYNITSLMALYGVVRSTIYVWVEKGLLPKPFMTITSPDGNQQSIWLFHQVRPTYVWQQHLKSRGIHTVRTDRYPTEIRLLKGQIKFYDRLFHKRMGIEYLDPYTKVAGKYGVIWKEDPLKN